jgi:hypothetical protein
MMNLNRTSHHEHDDNDDAIHDFADYDNDNDNDKKPVDCSEKSGFR